KDEIIRAFTGLQGSRFVVGDLKISGDCWVWKIIPDGRRRLCGCCGKEAPGYDRAWIHLRDIPLGVQARAVTWKVRRSRVKCLTCGIVVEKLPFRGRFGQLTRRCESWVIELLFTNQITVQDVSRIFLLNYHTVYRIDLE